MTETNQKIAKILSLALKQPVTPESNFRIGSPPEWDSLSHLEVMLLLEEEFSIQISPEQIAELVSQKQISEFLSR